ncbi:hypothetical protein B0H14DRAFT_3437242 [Mycena olivaceomarginata]|nr:hypothetical protein B0H14DRAFT_3437242 [Mycena olivaceomarginata]
MKVLYLSALFLPWYWAPQTSPSASERTKTPGKRASDSTPPLSTPAAGDFIVWEFRSGSHSAVQSTFDNPCTPMDGGFNSGCRLYVSDSLGVDAPGLPSVRLLVNDSQPLWFFDQAGGLCTQGAVISVNPSATQTDAAFKANAASAVASNTTSSSPSSAASAPNSASSAASASASASGSDSAAPAGASQPSGSGAEQVLAGGAYGVALLAVLWALL